MGLAKGGKDRTLLVLAEQPDERGVLPQLDSLAGRRGEHLEDRLRPGVDDARPLVEPGARPWLALPESLDVPASLGDRAQRITHDLAGHGTMQPQGAQLLAAEFRSRDKPLEVHAPDPSVDTDPYAGQLPGVAQIDHVLARAAEEPRGLLSGQNVLPVHAGMIDRKSPKTPERCGLLGSSRQCSVLTRRRHTFPLLADAPDQLRLERGRHAWHGLGGGLRARARGSPRRA